MEQHMNELAIAVPYWPDTKPAYKPRRKSQWTYLYLYPTLFFFYFIALWLLFGLYKLMLLCTLRLYLILKKLEKQRLKKRLVIVGGGYAGTYAAKTLEHEFLVTLIDNKDYFEFTPSKLRLLVEPKHNGKVQVKHNDFLSKTLVVTDWVKHITPENVITDTQAISYDYLLICSGARTPNIGFQTFSQSENKANNNINIQNQNQTQNQNSNMSSNSNSTLLLSSPLSSQKYLNDNQQHNQQHKSSSLIVSVRTQHFEDYHGLLTSAQRILIVGGGTVGVELAGEIIEHFKDKQITIVHSNSKLMHRSPEKAIIYTEEYFKRNGSTIIFNDKVLYQDGNLFKTSKGEIIEADIAFLCTGNVPNTDFLQNKFFSDYLNKYGFVKVNRFLQLENYNNIFVAGDLTDIPEEEEKLCQTAAAEVKTVVNNIKSIEANLPLSQYVAGKCPMLVSLGKYDGVCIYRGFTLTGFVPAAMKEFVEWKEMVHYWNWNHFNLPLKTKNHLQEQWSSHAHIV